MKNNLEERVEKIEKSVSEILELMKKQNEPINVTVQEETEWKPEENKEYWYVNLDNMTIPNSYWYNDIFDNVRLNHKLIFKTEEEASDYLEYLKAKEKVMNEFSQEEWENDYVSKYYIYYDFEDEKFVTSSNQFLYTFNVPYFRKEKAAQEFIDKYEKQIRRDMGIK